jgi:hypothetical protein
VHQLGSAQCSQKLMVGQINMHPPKKEKKVVSTPMNLLLLKDISSHSHVQGKHEAQNAHLAFPSFHLNSSI